MDKRELKRKCFIEALEDSVVHVEMVLNQLNRIDNKKGLFDEDILFKDKQKAILDLELSLVSVSILLRKMAENSFISIDDELRRDMNSLIHSSRFDYDDKIYVYSKRGKEDLNLDGLLDFCHDVLSFDNVHIKKDI